MSLGSFFALLTCLLLLTPAVLSAQSPSDAKFKLAQSYEQSGDLRNAARLYQELYSTNKSEKYFDGVARSLSALGQYTSLSPLILERIETAPSAKLYALYGAVLWRSGSQDEADKAWKKGLDYAGNEAAGITAIASVQSNLRLFDKAIATYLLARKNAHSDTEYADELAGLYGAVGNFERGTEEILAVFDGRKNFAQAQGRLSALMINPDANDFIGKKLALRANNSNNYSDLKLYLWFLRETKNYSEALEIADKIDKSNDMKGRELFDFAEGIKRDGDYATAQKAYSHIIEIGKSGIYYSQALYGYARALEAHLSQTTTLNKKEADDILRRYDEIIKNFPNTPLAADCQYRRGVIMWEYLHDGDKAKNEFSKTLATYGLFAPAAAAAVMSGTISIAEGDTAQAMTIFSQTASRYAAISPDDADKARFYTAELLYYSGKFVKAKEVYNSLAAAPNKDIANDALERIIFLEQNNDAAEGRLQSFGQAELLEAQRKFNESLQRFQTLLNEPDDIAERSYIKASSLALALNNIAAAQGFAEVYLLKFPEALYGDKAMIMLANIYNASGEKDKALGVLTDLLARYPHSIYVQEARDKIRKLRGDA